MSRGRQHKGTLNESEGEGEIERERERERERDETTLNNQYSDLWIPTHKRRLL